MSCTIYLIVEDLKDKEIVEAILKAKKLSVRIEARRPTGGAGGISRLSSQLERLIQTARKDEKPGDCIAVLHDADEFVQPNRKDFEQIHRICSRYGVVEVIARDEIEAWLLADNGVSKWLGIKHENHDSKKQPSETLASKVNKKIRKPYMGQGRAAVLREINGDSKSPSMQAALRQLKASPCYQNVAESKSDL